MAFTLTFEPELYDVRLDVTVPAGADRLSVSRVGPSSTVAYVRGWQEADGRAGPGDRARLRGPDRGAAHLHACRPGWRPLAR